MKYVVMECHDAYAVLMDEAACFVHAANLHYTVGQTVTDPVLMQSDPVKKRGITRTVRWIAAAAACLLIAGAGGFRYYSRNLKTHSVVVMSSDANIKMYLNRNGKVLYLKSEDEKGAALLEHYNGKNKSKIDAANELLAMEIAEGYLSSGDTVDFYISTNDRSEYTAYKNEFETQIPMLQQVKVNVQSLAEGEEIPKPEPPAEKPKPDAPKPKDSPKDPPQHETKPADKPQKPAKPDQPDTPAVKTPDAKDTPAPPAPAGKTDAEKPTPPAPSEKPDPAQKDTEKPDEPDKPAPETNREEIIPAPAKPEEQEGGKPAPPDPDKGHAGIEETEKKPEALPPVAPRPAPIGISVPDSEQPEPLPEQESPENFE